MQQRTHMSRSPGKIILREVSVTERGTGPYKPAGFWYEVGGDWRRWCAAEDFACGQYMHSVSLNDCNVLFIDTLEKLDAFHREFHTSKPLGRYRDIEINWQKVAERYDGVEIAPYQWERRHAFSWYYGWDCASGVLWRPRNAEVFFLKQALAPAGRNPQQAFPEATGL